ncbi:conserved hypothetical protein [Leishmania infantum JPCM5]|uniref:Uncharacterized protein n=2 Tax=Leishmania infantum TaxID=5671 RepID=A4HTW4_LEIIN|nr:conserved hypothetical protein [Leishmania infantum JPCM5]CAC9453897.1 hypothetical_protein_-__conserved [Leishmania infantum]CAM65870.1 conserved hypothetical protein [Leishmania infantum JPCM5]SUZ39504.1 hypothetical_protein_-__conserved [Leishmania infantum]|eukprot:XP_001463505.1 conserved hypothetical protein [Leishmania infantum JPCM5]
MQLSTEGYHEELRLLREKPELLSSGAEMEVRKVWRERLWMDDELEKAELRPSTSDVVHRQEAHGAAGGIAALSSPFAPYHVGTAEHAARQRQAAAPMMEEVDEVVVMAQHVVFRVGHDEIASHFSAKHPNSIIDASALASVQHVELGAMPPAKHMREQQQQQQERAVKQHLASLRRFSLDTPYELKECLARDIVAGRVDVPMQTAITDAVMDEQQCSLPTTRRPLSPDLCVFPSPRTEKSSAAARRRRQHDDDLPAPAALIMWQLPLRKPKMPTTPLWQRPWLPPGAWAVEMAHCDVTRAEALIRASAVRDPLAVEKRTAAIKDSIEVPRHHQGRPRSTGVTTAATDGEQHRHNVRVRRQEAAVACTDGTENLYGLQYVWRSPLPPGGFIRVSPDPRIAMWPDSEDEDSDDGALDKMEKYDNSQARGVHAGDGGGIREGVRRSISKVSTGTSQHHGRQAQMRRLARCVNRRTHKLRWLHSIGRRHVCYKDLALSDSDNSTGAASASSSSSSQCTSPTVSALRDIHVAVEVKKASKRAARLPLLHGNGKARRRQRRRQEGVDDTSRGPRPVYDGVLNINIYAEIVDSQCRNASVVGTSPLRAKSQQHGQQASNAATTTRRFLGCYRQSRLLIHFKLYCRALYEEQRVRRGGAGTHVIGRAGGSAPEYTPATEGLLAGVPAIPHPVLKLQEHAPSLRKSYAHRIPVASTMSGCRCWEGLYPALGTNLATPVQQAWRQLQRSSLVRQALRDIYDELPHDKEGLLDKRTFVLFVLQLLELFFPTRLPAAAHIAIAEEEWVYRGTTEHVGPQTFHEKFFVFPFIFYRDIAAVTEAQLVEFWTLVRVCFDAQKRTREKAAAMSAAVRGRSSSLAGNSGDAPRPPLLSLLTPLTLFTAEQLDVLLSRPPPAFDVDVYDRYCLLRQAFREDPKVRAAPRGHQYVVARSVVEAQQQKRPRASNLAAQKGNPAHKMSAPLTACRTQLCSADVKRRAEVAAAAQRERESRQRSLEAQEHKALLEQSDYYQARIGRIQSRAATVISGIESTCSTWELHRTEAYAPPQKDENADARLQVKEDVEELLLEYLDDVPLDVFDGPVSLRERYLLHAGLRQERLNRTFSPLQPPPAPAPSVAPADDGCSAALPPVNPVARATPSCRPVKADDVALQYMAVMTGGLGATQRRIAVSEEMRPLLDGTNDVSGGAVITPPTTSYVAGMYPLRAVRRTVSSVLCPSRVPSRRRSILNRSSEASLSGACTTFCSVLGVEDDGRIGAASTFSSFYTAACAPHAQLTRGVQRKGVAASASACGVSGRYPRKDEDAVMEAMASSASLTGVRNKSCYRKPAAVQLRQLSRPATPAVSATPFVPVSPLLRPRDGGVSILCGLNSVATMPASTQRGTSPLPQHQQLLTSAKASSTAALETAWTSSVMLVDLGEEVTNASPGSAPRVSQQGSMVVHHVGARPPHPPALSTVHAPAPSASLHYAQRLRAQKRRQEQYKRQFNNAAKTAAGVACRH